MKKRKLIQRRNYKKARVFGLNMPLFMAPLFVVLLVASVFITIGLVTSGSKLAKLERERATLSKENEDIKRRLVNDSSLTELSEKADDLGFKRPQEIIYVTEIETLAKLF